MFSASSSGLLTEPSLAGLCNLLAEPKLTDLLLNGPSETFADYGAGLRRVSNPFVDGEQLEQFARQAMIAVDKHIDYATPANDATLPGSFFGFEHNISFRVHAVLASAITEQTLVSIRKHSSHTPQLHEFAVAGLELEIWLRDMLERRENFIISGATGAGKTTLLKALLANAQGERIIAIEDSGELTNLPGHALALQARQPNTEGRGAVSLDDLVRQALRMRPDRIVLGEVRGVELLTLLAALNTGHRGAAGSIHANSAKAVSQRIQVIGLQAGLSIRAINAAFASAVQWVIHVERLGNHRLITEVARVGLDRRGSLRFDRVPELEGHM